MSYNCGITSSTEVNKQPIKRLEIPISKFNDVAIPHHVDLLKRHKNNIKKYQNVRDWDRVYTEQVNASRVVKQLKQLLYEMDMLRAQVSDADINAFDKMTSKARTNTLNAIKEYLELEFHLPLIERPSSKNEDQPQCSPLDNRYIQLKAEQEELERQQACLHAWNSLQDDLQQLHQLFIDFNTVVHEQAEQLDIIEAGIDESHVNVQSGTKSLRQALSYKTFTYPLVGALLGTCLGGPVGLVAGLKLGSITAIGGGLLGFTSGTLVKRRKQMIMKKSELEFSSIAEELQRHSDIPPNHNDKKIS